MKSTKNNKLFDCCEYKHFSKNFVPSPDFQPPKPPKPPRPPPPPPPLFHPELMSPAEAQAKQASKQTNTYKINEEITHRFERSNNQSSQL